MDIFDKLQILADSAKYDVACTSSGTNRNASTGKIGNAVASGICHSFSADGRCISLLKVLLSNVCVYNCKYCVNRSSNDIQRATFTPRELAELTINFYRRNYIEGLFLSSGIVKNPDYTCEKMIETLRLLREDYGFNGYIHAKAIPGADNLLLSRLGYLSDRMSVNIELPSQSSLKILAPDKSKISILRPMGLISDKIQENRADIARLRHADRFVPAGQSTQMIVGATSESDYQILKLSASLYKKYKLKRVFTRLTFPSWITRCYRRLPQNHHFYASTGCIRRTGCCASMDSPWMNCSMSIMRISIPIWIPNATGRSITWNCFP